MRTGRKIRAYIPPVKYTEAELNDAYIRDLLNDARCSEEQAVEGPFYPEKGITAESLLAYAAKCRAEAKDKQA